MNHAIARGGFPGVLLRFAWWLAGLAALSLVWTLAWTHLLHTAHPYGVTLFWDRFGWSDFTVFAERSRHFRSAAYWDEFNYPLTYPAPLGVVFGLFYKLSHPLAVYLALCAAGLTAWAVWLARGLAARGMAGGPAFAFVAIVLLACWPVVALLDTANIEGLLAILLAAGVLCVLRGRAWTGAALIGVAASMKLFPFILLALLLSMRRRREFAAGLAVMALTTLGSLALLGPDMRQAQQHIDGGMRFVKLAFIFSTQREALNFSHSLFSPWKFAVVWASRHVAAAPQDLLARTHREDALLEVAFKLYMAASAGFGLWLYFARIRRLPLLNQTLALTVCAVLLPPLSADYTLLELLLPFGLLCLFATEAWRNGVEPPGLRAALVCFAWIFGWETFLTMHASFDRPARALALCVLLVVVVRHRFPWPALDGVSGEVLA